MMITQPQKQSKLIQLNQNERGTKQSKINKCQQLAKEIQNKIQSEISNGEIKVRDKPLHIQFEHQKANQYENPQGQIRDKISSLNMDLQQLHKQIALQKEEEKMKEQRKRIQAIFMIQRLKKQKQEHHNKLKLHQMSQRLKYSAFSEDVMKVMRQRRQSLIQQKKRDMELRIYKNLNRRSQREEGQAQNQISYWSKIKQFEDNKRYQSTKVLPSIYKMQTQQSNKNQLGLNLKNYEKKKEMAINPILKHKKSFSKQDLTTNYQDAVHKFLERAKAKQRQSKSQKSPSQDQKSFIVVNQPKPNRYGLDYFNEKPPQANNQKMEILVANYYNPNKRKVLGDQYLKQSLIRVKQDLMKSSRKKTIQDNNSLIEESLELKGNQATLQRNDKLSILEERRQKILQNLVNNKISKPLAIEMLGPVENKLDRINPQGIQERLKNKIHTFEQISKRQQPKIQKLNEQAQKQQQQQQKSGQKQELQNEFQTSHQQMQQAQRIQTVNQYNKSL